jgi:hypothetical protein
VAAEAVVGDVVDLELQVGELALLGVSQQAGPLVLIVRPWKDRKLRSVVNQRSRWSALPPADASQAAPVWGRTGSCSAAATRRWSAQAAHRATPPPDNRAVDEQPSRIVVEMALIPDDGPTGRFFDRDRPIAW